jgi:glyceraldehyde-3-phosphate dehydrogenase (NADP+)
MRCMVIERLDAGAVVVNDSTDYCLDSMPFGGIKGFGIGREGVRSAVIEMTEPKVVCFHRANRD